MIFARWLLLILLFTSSRVLFAQEDDISTYQEEEPEKKLEWNGNLDVKYKMFSMDQNSSQYKLQFLKELPS